MTTPTPSSRTNESPPVIANEREAIQLMPATSLPSQQPLANHQPDCVAPARNDDPQPSLRGAKRRGNPASSCTINWIASQARNDAPRHRERTSAPTVIANEREAIQLETGEKLQVPTPSLRGAKRRGNPASSCTINWIALQARNDATRHRERTSAPTVIANEREAIQLETGEKLQVPTPSLRGAKRRGNPASSCTINWIASQARNDATRHHERTSLHPSSRGEACPPQAAKRSCESF